MRDKNSSARVCAKNARGGGGLFAGHYGNTVGEHDSPLPQKWHHNTAGITLPIQMVKEYHHLLVCMTVHPQMVHKRTPPSTNWCDFTTDTWFIYFFVVYY